VMVEKEIDIIQSLHILLSTTLGERVMHPQFGCDMERLTFEPLNLSLETYMKDLIEQAILWYEPRIRLETVTFTLQHEDSRIDIDLQFTIKTTNGRNNYIFPFYRNESANIHDNKL
jgi:uncharacterized protein